MLGYFDFTLDLPGLEDTRFLICRERLSVNGDLETAFLDGLVDIRRHAASVGFGTALATALAQCGRERLVVVRNPGVVLDAGLAQRISTAMAVLPAPGDWAIAAPGGLGPDGRRHLGLYATQNPVIPDATGPHPLVDAMPDLVVLNAPFAREVLSWAPGVPDAALEPVLAAEGYLAGRVSVFLPGLVAAIDGALAARDIDRLADELSRHFADRLAGQKIETLSGPVRIACEGPAPPKDAPDLADHARAAIAGHCDPLSLSIVVRTRFDRDHLLRRLLTSISRARRQDGELEVVLSTDADAALCDTVAETLRNDFRNLTIRLARHAPGAHSRVGNMLGGLRAARNEYVVLIDDDDYVDLFAFDAVAPALFAGNRPLIVTGSEVHDETWEETPGGRWVLTGTSPRGHHAAAGWRDMFTGVNRLPVSSVLMPRASLVARLGAFAFGHDLSEDYALFLLVLTDPSLPAIAEVAETFSHISVRGTENSITMPDRRPWARDIAAYLGDLAGDPRVAGAGTWQLLACRGHAEAAAMSASLADLRASLERAETELRLLGRANAELRRQLAAPEEAAA